MSPGESAPVATWYVSGWKRWKLRRSTSVISTGASARCWTACSPPKPPPTTTTRWGDSAEGEAVGLNSRRIKPDLEGALGDRALLADELVQPRLDDPAAAGAVAGDRGRVARRLSVDEDGERHGGAFVPRPQDDVDA